MVLGAVFHRCMYCSVGNILCTFFFTLCARFEQSTELMNRPRGCCLSVMDEKDEMDDTQCDLPLDIPPNP